MAMLKIKASFAVKQNEIIVSFGKNSEIPNYLFLKIGSQEVYPLKKEDFLTEKHFKGYLGISEKKCVLVSYYLKHRISKKDIRNPFTLCLEEDGTNELVSVVKLNIIDKIYKITDYCSFPEFNDERSTLKLFAPTAEHVHLLYFENPGHEKYKFRIPMMQEEDTGVWTITLEGNHHGAAYLFEVHNDFGIYTVTDPYSIALSLNSEKSVIIDLNLSNPKGWNEDKFISLEKYTDAVLYETHIRDLSACTETNIVNKRKYLGFVESGKTNSFGEKIGIDHIEELGITHIHLLPIHDCGSVDDLHPADYNWGYDPNCYTVPEGSYSSNPRDPVNRIFEFKTLVREVHKKKIGVVLDVVYNHTFTSDKSIFNKIIPFYYYRINDDGSFSNGSGCGNEIASERKHVRKFIIDTLSYWQREYHIDGFRFDLMGLTDTETMIQVNEVLKKSNSSTILYGEPWTGGTSVLPDRKKSQKNIQLKTDIAVFNDDLRNALKGYPDDLSIGFVSGDNGYSKTILTSMLGSIKYDKNFHSLFKNPTGTINYSCCHDNLTLYDKLLKSTSLSPEEIFQMNKLTAFIVVFSFGIPFLFSGEEFMRTKYLEHNTYNMGDMYNCLNWNRKHEFIDLFEYYKNLISLRKKFPAFRIDKSDEIINRTEILFYEEGFFSYLIRQENDNDLILAVNNTDDEKEIKIPHGKWDILVSDVYAGKDSLGICEEMLYLHPESWFMLARRVIDL